MNKELIIVGVGSDAEFTLRWCKSIRNHFNGKVILYITEEVINDLKGDYFKYNINLRIRKVEKDFWNWKNPNAKLFGCRGQWKYIKEVADEFPDNPILRTDIWDVILNDNPLKYLENFNFDNKEVIISEEGILNIHNSFMMDMYNVQKIDITSFKYRQVLNGGLTLAKGKYLSEISDFILNSKFEGLTDQHYLNYYLYNNGYKITHIDNFLESLFWKRDLDLDKVCFIHSNGDCKNLVNDYWNNKYEQKNTLEVNKVKKNSIVVTISTKGRYFTTLPLCIQGIINQTLSPNKLVIYDDNDEPIDLRNENLYQHLMIQLYNKNIEFEVIFGEKKGQVYNHQSALKLSFEYIWRIDDDCVADSNVLENLFSTIDLDSNIGAVSCSIISPLNAKKQCDWASNKIEDIFLGQNIQWYKGNGLVEVDHLYSSFLFRVKAANTYNLKLSSLGFREETMFTYDMVLNDWKLVVDFNSTIWHYDSFKEFNKISEENYKKDSCIFLQYLIENGIKTNSNKIIILSAGLGDHYTFKSAIKDYNLDDLIIFCCFKEVFEDLNIKTYSIGEAAQFYNIEEFNIYLWMEKNNWNKSIIEAYQTFYKL